jgi:hypothetical protein
MPLGMGKRRFILVKAMQFSRIFGKHFIVLLNETDKISRMSHKNSQTFGRRLQGYILCWTWRWATGGRFREITRQRVAEAEPRFPLCRLSMCATVIAYLEETSKLKTERG